MAEISSDSEITENTGRSTRPSLTQVKAIVNFIQKYPDMAHRKLRYSMSHEKFKKLWVELSNMANSMNGAIKSTKGWTKFWSDKRRSIVLKQKQISEGKTKDKLTPLEQKILKICSSDKSTRRNRLKQDPSNGDHYLDDVFNDNEDEFEVDHNRLQPTHTVADEKHISLMEKMVEVMDQQAVALTQVAQATLNNSKAMETIADASYKQALAVDRLAYTFETINTSVYDVRNAIISIDYTLKRCYSTNAVQQRQNTNLFS